jgi:pilus assembly protein CpaC
MQGKSAGDADFAGPRPVVFGVAALTLNPALTPVVASDYRAAAPIAADGQMKRAFFARHRQIRRDRPAARHQGCAGRRSEDRQRRRPLGAARLHHRRAVGQTNIVFFDSAGQQIAAYDIAVKRDLNGVRAALKQTLPNADIQIEGVGDGVMLTGSASSPIEAQQAGDLAARLVGGADKVVNSIVGPRPRPGDAEGHVAEVRRDIIKQMGIDLSASMNYGTAVVNFNNANPFTANSAAARPGNGHRPASFGPARRSGHLRAMESAGVVRTLAEPNLTAISGESATFISAANFQFRRRTCDPDTHVSDNASRSASRNSASRSTSRRWC